ncbi:hypothetical protein ABZ907_05670 [Nonomuraea wenchangensis]
MAVFEGRVDNARVLLTAGADPWRPMMDGWSPGRLSLASPTPTSSPPPSTVSHAPWPPARSMTLLSVEIKNPER